MKIKTKIAALTGIVSALLICSAVQASEYEITQEHKTFKQNGEKVERLQVKVGDTVAFRNGDRFFHNIYSLSDTKNFDLGSYRKGTARSVTFDKVGLAEIECAIHPEMYMEVEVIR